MKRLFWIFTVGLFFLILPHKAYAHLQGQQPFFMINDVYTPLYPVPTTSLSDFILPQDIAPKTYLINESIQFAIDTTKLPMVSEDALRTMVFTWDFGDDTSFEGTEVEHTYTKIGSYILTIYARAETDDTPVLLQSVLIHILPNRTYILPRAVIKVDGKKVEDPLIDSVSFSLSDPLSFDASDSKYPSSDIVSYIWDFGDMNSSAKKYEKHIYTDDLRIVFPVLRIKDKNGFISDAFIQINNTAYENRNNTKDENPKENWIKNSGIIFVCILLGSVLVFLGVFLKKRNST